MSYKIVIDSCGELTEELKQDMHFESVPLEIFVDDYHIVDDETFDQAEFLKRVAASPNCLHIFDSKSASVGETLVGMKIQEYEEAGLSFEEVVEKVESFIAEKNTSFVLETLETLRKNGRLSNIKAFVANTLNIKPVMAGSPEGTIYQLGQARGITKAVDKMIKDLVSKTANPREKIFAISHCNCPERAKAAVDKIKQMAEFKKIIVVETAGISSLYANDGGIIMVV